MNKRVIIARLRAFLEKRAEIIFAYIHGSFAEGLAWRDIDVAVYVSKDVVPEDEAIDYGLRISAISEMETGIRPLDIKVINYATIGFRYYATKGILLFSKNEDIRYDFIEDTWKRYFDLLPKRKQILLDLVSP
ncbi:MAG: nucleotidyltransferase domain-containing protein [Thermodesulfovibrionales bacterium]